jgi:prepilin-type N-terminal cleavage/methylation domain-containing protein
MRSLKNKNSGLTLVELIVTIAILAVASTAIMGFLTVATRQYGKGNNEVSLQYEAQLANNQLMNLILDTQKGITYQYNTATNSVTIHSDADIPNPDDVVSKTVYLYAYDEASSGTRDTYFIIVWEKATKKLYITEYDYSTADPSWTPDHDPITKKEMGLLSNYVEDFSLDLNQVETEQRLRMNLTFKNESEYHVNQNITLRNKIKIDKTVAEIYGH